MISPDTRDTLQVGYDEFCGALAAKDLQPLWTQSGQLMPPQPVPATKAWLWKWTTLQPLAERAGQLITLERGGDRRVLALANPGLAGLPYTSSTLWGAIQHLRPGETAPAHRHTPAALRFVLAGTGVWTTVQGDALDMSAGDLILTPSWQWHDHTSASDEPMSWFDGLDLPLVSTLESVFFENYNEQLQPVLGPHNRSDRIFGGRGTQPLGTAESRNHSPLLAYRWRDTDASLSALLESGSSPIASLEFVNPSNGRSAMPTLGCEMHRIMPDERTRTRRKLGSSIYVVFRGRGCTIIDGQRFDWEPRDIFVTPSWAAVDHQVAELADIFAVSDRPILQALHLFREEIAERAQEITGTFQPK